MLYADYWSDRILSAKIDSAKIEVIATSEPLLYMTFLIMFLH